MRELPVGTCVRVGAHHRIGRLRGMIGEVVGRYGGDAYVAVEVRLADGRYRLFWPEDLEEISSPPPWWWSLLPGDDTEWAPE